jgi:hypothetical protein
LVGIVLQVRLDRNALVGCKAGQPDMNRLIEARRIWYDFKI